MTTKFRAETQILEKTITKPLFADGVLQGTLHDAGETAPVAVKDGDHLKLLHLEGGKGYSLDVADLKDGNVYILQNKAGAALTADTVVFTGFDAVYDMDAAGAEINGDYPVAKESWRIITVTENGGNWYANVMGGRSGAKQVFISATAPAIPAYDAIWVQPGTSAAAATFPLTLTITNNSGSEIAQSFSLSPHSKGTGSYPVADMPDSGLLTISSGTISHNDGAEWYDINFNAGEFPNGSTVTITIPQSPNLDRFHFGIVSNDGSLTFTMTDSAGKVIAPLYQDLEMRFLMPPSVSTKTKHHANIDGVWVDLHAGDTAGGTVSPNGNTYTEVLDDRINFVVDKAVVGTIIIDPDTGLPKHTLHGILDPDGYLPNPLTISQRDALITKNPAKFNRMLVWVKDGTIDEYQCYNHTTTSWETFPPGSAAPWQFISKTALDAIGDGKPGVVNVLTWKAVNAPATLAGQIFYYTGTDDPADLATHLFLQDNDGVPQILEQPPTAIADWAENTQYKKGTWVLDTTIDVQFKAIIDVDGSTVPPSQDPVNWLGEDLQDIGLVVAFGQKTGRLGYIPMAANAILSRTKYVRLFDTIAPLIKNIGITSASNVLRLDPGIIGKLAVGDAIEVPGVPAGTTIATLGSGDQSKVGSVNTGSANLFFKVGVIATGFNPTVPAEVDGPGLPTDATATVKTLDVANAAYTINGKNTVTDSTAGFTLTGVVVGQYVNGPGIPANSRVIRKDLGTLGTINCRYVNGNTTNWLAPNFYSVYDPTMIIGRRIGGMGAIVSIIDPEGAVAGSFNFVSGQGYYWPWDLPAAEQARMVVNRVASGGPITPAAGVYAPDIVAPQVRNGGVVAGQPSLFLRVGEAVLPTATVERKVGNASGAIPADAYVTAVQAEFTATITRMTDTFPRLFVLGNFAASLKVGQFVSPASGMAANSRVLSIQSEQNFNNVGHVTGQNKYFMPPGMLSQVFLNQYVGGGGIPANTYLTAIAGDFGPVSVMTVTGSTTCWLAPGTTPAQEAEFTGGRRLAATGLGAANSVQSAVTASATNTDSYAISGLARIFYKVGAATTGQAINGRRVVIGTYDSTANAALAPEASLTGAASVNGTPELWLTGGQALPSSAVVGASVNHPNLPANARLVSTTPSQATVSRFLAGNTTIYFANGTAQPANPTSRGIIGTGLAANSRITAWNAGGTVVNGGRQNSPTTFFFYGTAGNKPPDGLFFTGAGVAPGTYIVSSVWNAGVGAWFLTTNQNATLGAQNNVSFTFGPSATLSAAPTAAGNNATFLAGVTADANATADGSGSVTFGASIGTNAAAAANLDLGTLTTWPGFFSLLTAATATGTATDGMLGAIHTMSANSSAGTSNGTGVLGIVVTTDNAATASAPVNALFGAIHTLNAACTKTDNSPITYGGRFSSAAANATQRNITDFRLGVVLQCEQAATSTNYSGTTLSNILWLDNNVTSTQNAASFTFGGFLGLDTPSTATLLDQTYTFGANLTMSANATATSQAAQGRFLPNGYNFGDGSTTFQLPATPSALPVGARSWQVYAGA